MMTAGWHRCLQDGGRTWASYRANGGLADMFLPSLPGAPEGYATMLNQESCHYTTHGGLNITCPISTVNTAITPWAAVGAGQPHSMTGNMTIVGLPKIAAPVRTAILTASKVTAMPDGTLLASLVITPAAGNPGYDSGKPADAGLLVIIEAADRTGLEWRVVGTVPPSLLPESVHFVCGSKMCNQPSEHDMAVLPDGQIVVAARTGSPNPLFMARSSDRGVSWRRYPYPIAWSVYPRLLRLANGVVKTLSSSCH